MIIRSKREGRVDVKSGFYTEKRMKKELDFDKLRVCTNAGT